MDQAELDKSMKLLELVENDVSYVVASSYLPDSASTPVKGASNIGPRARIARSQNAKNVNCHVCSTHVRPPRAPCFSPFVHKTCHFSRAQLIWYRVGVEG